MIEAEGAVPEGLGDVGDAIFAHDVEGEAAGSGHDAGVVADTAGVLVEGDVPDIVVSIFNAPMSSDGGGPLGGCETVGGGEIVGDFTTLIPHAGGGGPEQGAACDADDGVDEGMPLGRGQGIADREDVDGAVLLAGSALVPRKRGVGGNAVVGDGADGVKQVGLVLLQLDQEMVVRVAGDLERFFDSAWRPG